MNEEELKKNLENEDDTGASNEIENETKSPELDSGNSDVEEVGEVEDIKDDVGESAMDDVENINNDVENINNDVETPEPEMESESIPEPAPAPEPAEKMLTQTEVNELVGRARAEGRQSAMKEMYGRYGVNDDTELNDIFGRGQGYDILNDEYNGLNGRYKELSAENALLKSKVVPERWADVKAILMTKGMDITTEAILAESATHPEWLGQDNRVVDRNAVQEPTPVVKQLGVSVPEKAEEDEVDKAMKYFNY